MAAVLIAVVLALLLGHSIPSLAGARQFGWFSGWLRILQLPGWLTGWMRSRFGILLTVGIPVAVVATAQTLLRGYWFDLPAFGFSVLVLFYCWGPRDLDRDVSAVIDAPDREHRLDAAAELMPYAEPVRLTGAALVESAFRGAMSRWFGVLLWFLLLGPFGAMLYRLAAIAGSAASGISLPPIHSAACQRLLGILNWPVSQLMVLSLGLVANMDAVFKAWRGWYAAREHGYFRLDEGFLGPVARAGVDTELADEEVFDPDDGSEPPPLLELQDAMSLLWRMLLLWLTVLALFVLAGVVN